ncbi:MAG: DUF1674 domain-containing protein [Acetobacteraceae bacterium]|nr:DUF1674 domain-containing protein [Acetobacteraceae bacterium]
MDKPSAPPPESPVAGSRPAEPPAAQPGAPAVAATPKPVVLPREIGGAPGPEPTRYGDWQHKGRVTDF